ncbi:hypothetical protein [Caldisericum sp.]|uniref:hypothetical protein n=1 Tax=Caldisericum sp. TaxID=2499687 RepID=UPI003D113225
MVTQLGYIAFSDNHFGIFIISNLPIDVIRSLFSGECGYIVSDNYLILTLEISESKEEINLVFPLEKIRKYPFYLSIFLFIGPTFEVEHLSTIDFTEKDIGEAQGYYRALVQLAKEKLLLTSSEDGSEITIN